ncbi:hypothetical protein N6B72_06035 [Chryseobacterium soli]|uniref:hypothetical protein n=1 Tax=Chryseobacterium soli TaxID=445961 RepID=UPI0029537273|nr:hypothetical protein [Chryseobacterium soli]MDV7696476.1 hypothetical protein [Chryseobacterium soli]
MTSKKINMAAVAIQISVCCCAQIGINTSAPQQALQISGSGTGIAQPIIRIDGLNSTNNPAHESTSSTKRVFADANGTLVIAGNTQTNKFYTSVSLPNTAIPAGTERAVISQTFTLDYPSIVHVEARVGIAATDNISDPTSSTSLLLRNGQARLFGSYYKLTAAPTGVATNTAFGQVIISHSTNTGGAQLDGQFYIEPKKDLYLPKGNYTLTLYGYAQDSTMNFAVNSLSQPTQQMMISITPVNY